MNKLILLTFIFCLSFFTELRAQSTASENVQTFTIEAPQLNTKKKIWLYLPETYTNSAKNFPVIYMHDAQNLFDAETSFSGEWKVDEVLDSMKIPEAIIVGIEHGEDKRIDELTPFPNPKYGGGNGKAYLNFITSELKPYIDDHYRTLKDAANTMIFGSSLGGLISFYAMVEHPNVFGKAGIFSPSFWFSDQNYSFLEDIELDKNQKFYFFAGTKESDSEIAEIEKMIKLLKKKGLKKDNYKAVYLEGGEHNEYLWSKAFPQAYLWLMKN